MEVNPIKDIEAISNLKKYLKKKPRDYALFVLGINTGLRIGDLRTLTVGQARGLSPMTDLVLKEEKTGKTRRITINQSAYDAMQYLLASMPEAGDTLLLFQSRTRGNQPLTVPYLSRLIKSWCRDVGIEDNCASHTLKKTFGFIQVQVFGIPVYLLCKMFGHSSESITLKYIGLQEKDMKEAYQNCI